MCQCGCGDAAVERAFKIERGPTIGYQLYRGCAECHEGLGIDLTFYNQKGVKDWVTCEVERAPRADEYGGNRGHGIAIPLFEVRDLIAASKERGMEFTRDYPSLGDWLEENGLRLLQSAIALAHSRASTEEP